MDDIPDLNEFIRTYLFESDGLIRRCEDSKKIENCYGSTSLKRVLLMGYPLGTRSVVEAVPEVSKLKPFETEFIDVVIEYRPKYEMQMIGVMTEQVMANDKFYLLKEARCLGRLKDGKMYTRDKVVDLFERETDDMIVEVWDNKIHDLLEVNGEACMNKPYSYRRHILESSMYEPYMTEECDLADSVICVRDDQYHPGAKCSYMEIMYATRYRCAAGRDGWVYKGVGAGNVNYVLAAPYTLLELPKSGCYLLSSDFTILGSSQWCHTMIDVKEVRNIKDFPRLYQEILQVNKEENGSGYYIEMKGPVIDVGLRFSVWRLSTKYNCTGRVYNKGKMVVIEVNIPLINVESFFFELGAVASQRSCSQSIEEKGEVLLGTYRKFHIVTSKQHDKNIDRKSVLFKNSAGLFEK